MPTRSTTCCFTGHRPKSFPWNGNPNDPRQNALLQALSDAIDRAIADGYTHFIAGNALGVDTWAAMLVLRKKLRYPEITLEIAVPFEGHNQSVGGADGAMLSIIHEDADRITVVTKDYFRTKAFHRRNRYMVDNSSRLIAVYDERSGQTGGTASTLRYAKEQGLKIDQIRWMDL